jgi:hypothetical protein
LEIPALNCSEKTGYNGPNVRCGGAGSLQATMDVRVISVMNILIKGFELIVIHFSVIKNLFYPDTQGKLVEMLILLFCRVFVFRSSDVIQNIVH